MTAAEVLDDLDAAIIAARVAAVIEGDLPKASRHLTEARIALDTLADLLADDHPP